MEGSSPPIPPFIRSCPEEEVIACVMARLLTITYPLLTHYIDLNISCLCMTIILVPLRYVVTYAECNNEITMRSAFNIKPLCNTLLGIFPGIIASLCGSWRQSALWLRPFKKHCVVGPFYVSLPLYFSYHQYPVRHVLIWLSPTTHVVWTNYHEI